MSPMYACLVHAQRLLATQMPLALRAGANLPRRLRRTSIQLYLAGVMWHFLEQFYPPEVARERGFVCLMTQFMYGGATADQARRCITRLHRLSRTHGGEDDVAIATGYRAEAGDGSLAAVFKHVTEVNAARWRVRPDLPGERPMRDRLLEGSRPVAVILAITGKAMALVLGKSWMEALGVGIVIGASSLAISCALHMSMSQRPPAPRGQAPTRGGC